MHLVCYKAIMGIELIALALVSKTDLLFLKETDIYQVYI